MCPRWCHIKAQNPGPSFGSRKPWGIPTAQFWCWRRGGRGEEGGLEGEARLANLFSATVMVQVATERSLDDPAHACSTLGFGPLAKGLCSTQGRRSGGSPGPEPHQRGYDGEELSGHIQD